MSNKRIGGRPRKLDPAKNKHLIRLTDEDNARFLSLFEQSGMKTKAHFITSRIFGESFKVIKIDKSAVEYYSRLTNFYSQFRAIGVNYNQVVKALKGNFTEKKALAFLYKLETLTAELIELEKKIIQLTEEYETNYLKKQSP